MRHIQPDIALISSSRWNPWHFPHQTVIDRLTQHHAKLYNTAEDGQIRVLFEDNDIKIQTARAEFSPWYRRLIGLTGK